MLSTQKPTTLEHHSSTPHHIPLRSTFVPPFVFESTTKYIVEFDIPGLTKEEIDASIEGDRLIVRAERSFPLPKAGHIDHMIERKMGKFQGSAFLPHGIRADTATTEYSQGVLSVSFLKSPDRKVVKIHKITTEPFLMHLRDHTKRKVDENFVYPDLTKHSHVHESSSSSSSSSTSSSVLNDYAKHFAIGSKVIVKDSPGSKHELVGKVVGMRATEGGHGGSEVQIQFVKPGMDAEKWHLLDPETIRIKEEKEEGLEKKGSAGAGKKKGK